MAFRYRVFNVFFFVLACVVLNGCATKKSQVPREESNSDAGAATRVDGNGGNPETPSVRESSPEESMKYVDLSVPGIEHDQRAIVDPIEPDSSEVAGSREDAIVNSASPAEGAPGDANAGADDWGRAVQQAIHSRWVQPRGPNIPTEFSCDVMVKLTPFGGVDNVKVVRSCGDVALDASVETAVRESSPLPTPKDPADFNDTLMLTFTPR